MKSPITRNPLRNPGQSLDRFILGTILDHQIKYVIIGLVIWMALIFNWLFYFTGKPFPPFWFSFVALVAFGLIYFEIRSAGRKLVGLRRGIQESIEKNFDVKKVVLFPGFISYLRARFVRGRATE